MNNKKLKRGIFIGIIILMIILFLLLIKSCSGIHVMPNTDPKQEEKEKAEIIQLIRLYDLLERADFCSKQWNEDAKEVVEEIELLATSKEDSSDQEIAGILHRIANDLNELSKKNSIENIDALEKSLNEFETIYGGKNNE